MASHYFNRVAGQDKVLFYSPFHKIYLKHDPLKLPLFQTNRDFIFFYENQFGTLLLGNLLEYKLLFFAVCNDPTTLNNHQLLKSRVVPGYFM